VITALLLTFVGMVAWLLTKAAEVAIQNEYGRWAPAVAREFTHFAGFIHPTRRHQMLADVLYEQHEGRTGLYEATRHLLGAPRLSLREAPLRVRARLSGRNVKIVPLNAHITAVATFNATVVRLEGDAAAISGGQAELTLTHHPAGRITSRLIQPAGTPRD